MELQIHHFACSPLVGEKCLTDHSRDGSHSISTGAYLCKKTKEEEKKTH